MGTWTIKANLNYARYGLKGVGTSNDTLSFSGYNGSYIATTESYNGTSWTSVTGLTTTRYGPGKTGVKNATFCFGRGNTSSQCLSNTEACNGTSLDY